MQSGNISLESVRSLILQVGGANRQQAEDQLMNFREDPGYLLALCELLNQETSNDILLVAALEFKNTVKTQWDHQRKQGCDQIHGQIISGLLNVVFSKDGTVADILTEGVVFIAAFEFPGRWESLPEDTLSFLSNDNHSVNFRIWSLIEGITKKYTYMERSDELFTEIIKVIDTIHAKLLYYSQGYLNSIETTTESGSLVLYFKTLSTMLKIFYNINWQDLHPLVEDNLQNWMSILNSVMKVQIKASSTNINLRDVYFFCKGDAINCALLYARKFQEEFMPMIEPFANEIWNICTESSCERDLDDLMIHSLHYFKTFVENPNFIDFFATRLEEIFKKLIIPIMSPSELVQQAFEDEADSFHQTLLGNKEFDEKTSNCAAFLRSLNRFQTEKVYKLLCELVAGYCDNFRDRGDINIENEITCINVVSNGIITGFFDKLGVSEINVPADIIFTTYSRIIKPGLTPIFLHLQDKKPIEQLKKMVNPVLFCYHLKFISNFRAFIDPAELIEIAKYASCLLQYPSEALQKTTLATLGRIINLNSYTTDDKMNAPVDESSFYSKYYLNPRKISKKINKDTMLFNRENSGQQLETILENLYQYCIGCDKLDSTALALLKVMFKIMGEGVRKFNGAICDLFEKLFDKFSTGYVYSSVMNLLESLGYYIIYTAGDEESENFVISKLIKPINSLMSKSINDITSLLLQIYSLMLKHYKNAPETTAKIVLKSLLDESNYTVELVSLFPAYSIFAQEYLRRNIRVLVEHNEGLMLMARKFLEFRIDNAFFALFNTIFELLSQEDLKGSGWLHFIVNGSAVIIANGSSKDKAHMLNSRPLYFKELFLFICRYGLKYTFQDFFEFAENTVGGSVEKLLKSDQLHSFIQAFQKQPERSILILGMTKLLFDEAPVLANLIDCWRSIFSSIISSLRRRKYGLKRSIRGRASASNDLTFMRDSESLQNRVIQDISGDGGHYKLTSLQNTKDTFVELLLKECGDDGEFCINKLKGFLQVEGSNIDFGFLSDEQKAFINEIN